MLILLLKRLMYAIPTLFALITITFFAMRMMPGGPFDSEKALPAEVKAAIEKQYHLDEPASSQYVRYLNDVIHFDFGPSYRYMGSRTVNEIIADSFPISAALGFWALVFAVFVGIPIGVLSARFRGSLIDTSSMFLAIAGVSLPSYLTASILILVFSLWLGWFPPALYEDWSSMVLPAITLGLRPLALIARVTRASLLDTFGSDYIRTAEAKGLPELKILFKHALKPSLIPVITLFGPLFAAVISGSFVIENIFAFPGMGKYFVSAVIDRDYTLLMGLTIVYGILVISANFLVDVFYTIIDPRIRVND